MNGVKTDTSGPSTRTGRSEGYGRKSAGSQPDRKVGAEVWERFVAGEDVGQDVRPEILASWLRCRDEHQVDPWRERAPNATGEESPHGLEDGIVVAELAGLAKSISAEAQEMNGLAAVADREGRVLAAWGSTRTLGGASTRNLARWAAWAEDQAGTNGLGTALEQSGATLVTQAEHWCVGFHDWTCAGVAIRDPVTGHPLGVLDISTYKKTVPQAVCTWLAKLVAPIEAQLQDQASRSRSELLSAFATHERPARSVLAAADNGGRFVAVNEEGRRRFGIAESAFDAASAPGHLDVGSVEFKNLILEAVARAHADHQWIGTAELSPPMADTELVVSFQPVISQERVAGVLIRSPGPKGERLTPAAPPAHASLSRVLGVRAQRLLVLAPEEIRFAEADGNTVWMTTDQGRMRAFGRGLSALEERVHGHGFLRVSRQSLVNLNRVREIAPSFKGGFGLVMDGSPEEIVPVSRRHVAEVRAILGL